MVENKRDYTLRQRASTIKTDADLVDSINDILHSFFHYQSTSFSLRDLREFSDLADAGRYEIFTIPKKNGETRTISAPKEQLKILLRALNRLLSNCYLPPGFVTGFVYSKSVVDNARIHVAKRYVLNVDLKDFFDSIPREKLIQKLTLPPFSFPLNVATTIVNLSYLRSSKFDRFVLAQGSPLSPTLSNIYCSALDSDLFALSSQYGVSFSRYADDLSFSSDENLFTPGSHFFSALIWSIQANGFVLNKDKVRLQDHHHRQSVTGLTVNKKVNVPRKYIKDIRNLLYVWERYGAESAYRCFHSFHDNRYPSSGTKPIPFFVDYLRGKIDYLGLVKGKDNPTYIKFKVLFEKLQCSKPFHPFRGESYRSISRFEKRRNELDMNNYSPLINKYGKRYYAIQYPVPGGEIIFSPKLYQYLELPSPSIPVVLRENCSVHEIYGKDGIKWIISENSRASIKNDVTKALNKEREKRISDHFPMEQTQTGIIWSEERLTKVEESKYSYLVEGSHTFDSDFGFTTRYKYFYCTNIEDARRALATFFCEERNIPIEKTLQISDESFFGGLRAGRYDDNYCECRIIRLK